MYTKYLYLPEHCHLHRATFILPANIYSLFYITKNRLYKSLKHIEDFINGSDSNCIGFTKNI